MKTWVEEKYFGCNQCEIKSVRTCIINMNCKWHRKHIDTRMDSLFSTTYGWLALESEWKPKPYNNAITLSKIDIALTSIQID